MGLVSSSAVKKKLELPPDPYAVSSDEWLNQHIRYHLNKDIFEDKERDPSNDEEWEIWKNKLHWLREQECGLWHYKPHRKQKWFHSSTSQRRLFCGSNQCLVKGSLIHNPVTGKRTKIEELKRPHWVWSFDGRSRVIVHASPSFNKGIRDLVRVTLRSGRVFVGSVGHRVLTLSGWRALSEVRVGSLLVRPWSTEESGQSAHVSSDPRSTGIAQDWQSGYRTYCRSCDARPRFALDSAQVYSPSRVDVQARSTGALMTRTFVDSAGAMARTEVHIHPCPECGRPSNQDGVPRLWDRYGSPAGCSDTQFSSWLTGIDRTAQQSNATPDPPPANGVFDLSDGWLESEDGPFPWTGQRTSTSAFSYEEVISVDDAGQGEVYDFTVPGTHNYIHAGVTHHNSGKTTALLAEILSWCIGYRPWSRERVVHPVTGEPVGHNLRAMIGCDDFTNKAAEVLIPKIKELIPWDIYVHRTEKIQGRVIGKIEFARTNSTLKFMSYTQEDAKWEGYTWDVVGFDEPCPRHAYIATLRGCMKRSAPIFWAFTPLSQPWMHEELYNHDRTQHINSEEAFERHCTRNEKQDERVKSIFSVTIDLTENPHVPEEQKREFVESLDPEERESRQHGKFRHLMGRIYKRFDEEHHVRAEFDWERSWPSGFVVDPHSRRPFACAWFVVSPLDEIIFIREWPDFDFYKTRRWDWGVDEYAEMLKRVTYEELKIEPDWWLMDPRFGRTPSAHTGRSLFDEFEERGLYFDRSLAADEIDSGHVLVRQRLGDPANDVRPTVYWHERCRNFIRGMTNYTWQEWRNQGYERSPKEVPEDKFKDFPDLVRYVCEAGVGYREISAPTVNYAGLMNGGLGARRYG